MLRKLADVEIEAEDISDCVPRGRKQAGGKSRTVQYLYRMRSRNRRFCAVRANLYLNFGLNQKSACFMMALLPAPRIPGHIATVTSSRSEWTEL